MTDISVIIATYGESSWSDLAWARAYPSVQAQDPPALEVLIGHDPNAFVSHVRNELAAKAKGAWLLFLDADDELRGGYIRAMQKRIEFFKPSSPDREFLFTPSVSYVRNGVRRRPRVLPQKNLQDDNWLILGTLVSRDLFMRVGGFEEYPHGFEDWSLWAKCWKHGNVRIEAVREAVYIAHVNPQSKHRQGWRDRKWQVAMHEQVRRELFPELYR